MEQKNIGILNIDNNKKLLDKIKNICNTALSNGIYVKVHNTDYLKKNLLEMFPSLKISAANVAPEFGVCETKNFINILEKHYLFNLENDFLEMAYNSNKWKKWVMLGSQISPRDKAILAGHYVFSDEKFLRIKEKAQINIKYINIDEYLKASVKNCIMNYINCFSVKVNTKDQAIC